MKGSSDPHKASDHGIRPWLFTTVPNHCSETYNLTSTSTSHSNWCTESWSSRAYSVLRIRDPGDPHQTGSKVYYTIIVYCQRSICAFHLPFQCDLRTRCKNFFHFQTFVHLEHNLTFPIHKLSARTHRICFPFAPVSHLFLLGILDSDVKGRRTAGRLISGTSSGERKWTGKRGRK